MENPVKPIPKEILAAAHRKLARGVGAQILQCMADTDTSFALIAVRLETTEKIVRGWMDEFMDGTAQNINVVSDMLFAMSAELSWSIKVTPLPEQTGA